MSNPLAAPLALLKFAGLCSSRVVMGAHSDTRRFFSHNDVALNFMERGWIRVLMATGYRYTLEARRLAVFWGAVPHRVEAFGHGSIGHSVVVPLGTFLRWAIPAEFTRQLIRGRVFLERDPEAGSLDLKQLNRWHPDIAGRDPDAIEIVLLELEARLRRLARSCPTPQRIQRITPRGAGSQAERMLLLVAEHFREPLSVADVAAAVKLHPVYAGSLFRRRMGIGLSDYITECRILHAKALLATTDAKMLDVARDSGFGSISQFHAIFRRMMGLTPRKYRVQVRSPQTNTPPRPILETMRSRRGKHPTRR